MIPLLAFPSLLKGQDPDKAELRLPHGELKQLPARADPVAKTNTPKPALLYAYLEPSVENDNPVIHAVFRVTSCGGDAYIVPMIAGDVALHQQEPADATVVIDGLTGITLALLMMLSARIDWKSFFAKKPPVLPSATF